MEDPQWLGFEMNDPSSVHLSVIQIGESLSNQLRASCQMKGGANRDLHKTQRMELLLRRYHCELVATDGLDEVQIIER